MDIDIKELVKTAAESLNLKDFHGDVVGFKYVENEFGTIESGGVGQQIFQYGKNETASNWNPDDKTLPHFDLESEKPKEYWVDVYYRMVTKGWIRKTEVELNEWLYVCCGKGTVLIKPIVWHYATNAMAYIVRQYFNSDWDVTQKVFCLKDNKMWPKSFKNTKAPAPKVIKIIDEVFKRH